MSENRFIEGKEMPLYLCHKKVWAAEIVGISPDGYLKFEQGSKQMSEDWLNKHNPDVGGFYVVYSDGYESYSPRAAFVGGYTLASP